MAIKLAMNAKTILDKVFPGAPRGYDPFLVDEFLDAIIKDYRVIENNVLIDKDELDSLYSQIESLKKDKQELEIELGKYKEKFKDIKANDNVSLNNLELLKRVNRLEKFLYSKGYNPENIK